MEIFSYLGKYDYEQVIFCHDAAAGLRAVIAIHDTTLGPALGGCRMWTYASEEEAVLDALRLARGMTYKAAAAGLNLGGGKTVVIGDPRKDKSEALFRALGRYIHSLGGRYITAEDVGTTVHDMDLIHLETPYVCGISPSYGSSGNPSPMTALGVFRGIQASAKYLWGSDDLSGRRVAVQGLGSVGFELARLLRAAGAELIVADINPAQVQRAVDELKAVAMGPSEILSADCDILAPCALGAVLNDETIPRLRAQIVAGSANNQLAEERHGDLLHERGILYAPDYVINAGGLINVADELEGYHPERARAKVEGIYDIMLRLYTLAAEQKLPTHRAADHMAEARIEQMRRVRSTYLGHAKPTMRRR